MEKKRERDGRKWPRGRKEKETKGEKEVGKE